MRPPDPLKRQIDSLRRVCQGRASARVRADLRRHGHRDRPAVAPLRRPPTHLHPRSGNDHVKWPTDHAQRSDGRSGSPLTDRLLTVGGGVGQLTIGEQATRTNRTSVLARPTGPDRIRTDAYPLGIEVDPDRGRGGLGGRDEAQRVEARAAARHPARARAPGPRTQAPGRRRGVGPREGGRRPLPPLRLAAQDPGRILRPSGPVDS